RSAIHGSSTVFWRLRRNDGTARATIVPHIMHTTLLVSINREIEVAEDFQNWSAALERATGVRAGLLRKTVATLRTPRQHSHHVSTRSQYGPMHWPHRPAGCPVEDDQCERRGRCNIGSPSMKPLFVPAIVLLGVSVA